MAESPLSVIFCVLASGGRLGDTPDTDPVAVSSGTGASRPTGSSPN